MARRHLQRLTSSPFRRETPFPTGTSPFLPVRPSADRFSPGQHRSRPGRRRCRRSDRMATSSFKEPRISPATTRSPVSLPARTESSSIAPNQKTSHLPGGTTRRHGEMLTARAGSWGPGAVTLDYSWSRNGRPIPGATSSTYTLTGADVGTSISVTVTGSELGFTTASRISCSSGRIR